MTRRKTELTTDAAAGQTEATGPDNEPKGEIQAGINEGAQDDTGLDERLKAAEAKAEENYDRLLRVTAEFENYKKRMGREMNEFRKFATESLIKDLLPVVDNLEMAIQTPYEGDEKSFRNIRDGVEMTLKGLLDTLVKHGIERIESLDKAFDPNLHQAITQETSEDHPDNTVCRELQKGYMMRDRLLRPAMVAVSRRRDPICDEESDGSDRGQKVDVTVQ